MKVKNASASHLARGTRNREDHYLVMTEDDHQEAANLPPTRDESSHKKAVSLPRNLPIESDSEGVANLPPTRGVPGLYGVETQKAVSIR